MGSQRFPVALHLACFPTLCHLPLPARLLESGTLCAEAATFLRDHFSFAQVWGYRSPCLRLLAQK